MLKKQIEKSVTSAHQWIQNQIDDEPIENYTLPKNLIIGFFPTLYQYIRQNYHTIIWDKFRKNNPIYLFTHENQNIAFVFPGYGASISTIILEECLTLGSQNILFIGTCGSMINDTSNRELYIVKGAYADEGTSKHYYHFDIPIFDCNRKITKNITDYLDLKNIKYQSGITWTTDAVYRETASKIKERVAQGCMCVDMEASALIAVANYYERNIGGFLVPSDSINSNQWKINRNGLSFSPSKLFNLALAMITS